MKPLFLALIIGMASQSSLSSYEQAFPKTDAGVLEIKTLPASRMIVSESGGHYFAGNNGLFRPLFRYISRENIAMTTPVEAEMMPGKMYFHIGPDAADRELNATDDVRVVEIPERVVASIGVRGAYTEANFTRSCGQLQAWLEGHPVYKANGEARGIFWNGPYVPWFLKHFEVHVPVVKRNKDGD